MPMCRMQRRKVVSYLYMILLSVAVLQVVLAQGQVHGLDNGRGGGGALLQNHAWLRYVCGKLSEVLSFRSDLHHASLAVRHAETTRKWLKPQGVEAPDGTDMGRGEPSPSAIPKILSPSPSENGSTSEMRSKSGSGRKHGDRHNHQGLAPTSPPNRSERPSQSRHGSQQPVWLSPSASPTPSLPIAPAPPLSPTPSLLPLAPAPSPSPSRVSYGRRRHNPSPSRHIHPPQISPSPAPLPPSVHSHDPPSALPSPPNDGCGSLVCIPPLAKTPFLSPCGCVPAIQVEIELSTPLYSLFPLISMLAADVAEGVVLSTKQVEIVGAVTDSQDPNFSIVDMNLVPLGQEFDNITALLIYQRFWSHELVLNETLFGNYNVIYVRYPGLPPSPPSRSSAAGLSPTSNGTPNQNPFGVDVKKKSFKLSNWIIIAISLSSAVIFVLCIGALRLSVLNLRGAETKAPSLSHVAPVSTRTRRSGHSTLSSELESSASMSYASSIATYTSSAKTFTFAELDRATDHFNPDNVIGEGGFGRVYSGIFDDGTKVAVKVLTRDDQQGGREFIAEVETLSRLHHRNLVKLIGICIEDHNRSLVYELIPNGSVESHLHGVDKETFPLDWDARMKIALGAARGLAYLHEDSNPRVIHRDFKASNILLENDFNPKVSDFGLAKAAPDEGSAHLSTRVMGTFGYVAPEYAMTGHLLVKSDVYSYGVVLLELLSGRKPVDMSQPQGQENLVTWARPLLTSEEGLSLLVDPALQNYPLDSLAKVAAIASMCVQPEVSHRPFMGEVVQALKLVYNDSNVPNGAASSINSQGGDSFAETETLAGSGQRWLDSKSPNVLDSFISVDYDSGPSQAADIDGGRAISSSRVLSMFGRHKAEDLESLRRHSLSGPLSPNRRSLRSKYSSWNNRQESRSECHTFSRFCVTE